MWGGRRCVAVVTHRPGHWVTYIRPHNQWWRVDSGRVADPRAADPFGAQNDRIRIMMLAMMP